MSKWIKKDDKVVIVAGNDRGRTGKVISKKGERVVVQGINIRKRHLKRQQRGASSEILEIECPIHISNVRICNEDGKTLKLKVKESKEGKKELIYLDGKKEVVYRQI